MIVHMPASVTVAACVVLYLLYCQEALQELQELQQIVPKESLVYFLMAKVRLVSLRYVLDVSSLPISERSSCCRNIG